MPIKCDEYNNVCVLGLAGDLAGTESDALRKQVDQLVDTKQIIDFVVDLEKTSFIDSEGLETLLWMKHKCEDLFGQMKLAALDENCKKILELTRLEHQFECHPDLPTALKTMR
jgi:anti-anti-sigma factor